MSVTRVLWLVKGLDRGGAETLLVSLARAMDRRDMTIEVAYLLPEKTALVRTLEELGIRTHSLGVGKRVWLVQLRALLASGRYDVVHSHSPLIGAVARLAAPRGTVLLHTEHNTWGAYHPATRTLNAWTMSRNDLVWAVSNQVAESVRTPWPLRPAPVEVMLHGVDPATMRHGREARLTALARLGIPDGGFVFGTVGNLAPKKDQGTMLRAFARVHRALPASWLVVIGSGPREAQLRALARQLGIDRVVKFLGMRDDVLDLLPGFDTFVLSSLHEGLSIALVEALATGVPIVATNVGGIPQLIPHDEHGVLVPPHDVVALERAMVRLALDDPARRRLTAAGMQRAAAFGIQPAADRLVDQYRRMARRGRPEVAPS